MAKFRVPIQRIIHDIECAYLDVEADDIASAIKKAGAEIEKEDFEVSSEEIKTVVGETDGWEIEVGDVRQIKEKTDVQNG